MCANMSVKYKLKQKKARFEFHMSSLSTSFHWMKSQIPFRFFSGFSVLLWFRVLSSIILRTVLTLSLQVFISLTLSHRFIKGFIYRHKERCTENEYFLDYVRYSFLMKLHRNLPKNVLDKGWPTPPAALAEVERTSCFWLLCFQHRHFDFIIYGP